MRDEIVVIGSLNTDLVTKVKHRPSVGETILGEEFFTSPGGKGANQAAAAAKFDGKVRMIGKVGGDHYGAELISHLKKSQVNTDSIFVDAKEVSGIATIIVDDQGDNSIIVVPGANNKLLPTEINNLKPIVENAKLLVLQLEIPLETVMQAIEIASAANVPVLLDPSPVPEQGLPAQLLNKISFLTPNMTELNHLSGRKAIDLESAIISSKILLDQGVQCVLAKLGEQGAVVSTNEEVYHVPGFPVEVIDTTAAGDTFIGALAAGMTKDLPLRECVRMANAAAALTVTKYGAQDSMPSLQETQSLMKRMEA